MTVAFAPGTPAEARRVILNCLALPNLCAELRDGIKRLAGHESMQDFWRELPARLQGTEEDVILWAIVAYFEAISLQPSLKEQLAQQKKRFDFLHAHMPITDPVLLARYKAAVRNAYPENFGTVAVWARSLRAGLDEISTNMGSQNWAEAWPGDPDLTFDKLRSVIDDIAACCDRLDAAGKEFRATLNLPELPRKRGGHTARQVHFTRILKARYRSEFGKVYPGIVATLVEVAFNLPEAVDESTVLKR